VKAEIGEFERKEFERIDFEVPNIANGSRREVTASVVSLLRPVAEKFGGPEWIEFYEEDGRRIFSSESGCYVLVRCASEPRKL